ncbi:phosphatase PAP2 family protein [Sphingomonas sp. G124]|uniref:Phosphatase PAP2 family protein n=1 Tax=Sphingomonas cremea TaxID=2904799 RepID=A0A9X1TX64_9SPHN|nr:phosphatase PAP2 family protein [Sphingomonas cremea]MCF2514825.1 phosphatase PAP2 family protein [Sphingomonas cremea]
MDDISTKRALAFPALLALVMLAVASAISLQTGVSGWRVFAPYLGAWGASTLLSMLVWMFVQVLVLLPTRADHPLQAVLRRVREPARVALLPAFIFPLFLGAYTWAKCSIPFTVGYGWEEVWANADRMIFGEDAWRWAHSVLPEFLASAMTFYYAVIWGFALVFSGTLISAFASRRFTATYFTALMLCWLIGGTAMAYSISAAGPVFAHLTDPNLADRFLPLRVELGRILAKDDLVLKSQRYLAIGMNMKIALKGGGVSAMPSMHIATATILALMAFRTRWFPLALLFWGLTFFGSIYLGYHYAVDAPVAAIAAVFCWIIARKIFAVPSQSMTDDSREALASS